MTNNPFNLTFGKEPSQMISRFVQTNEIIENFTSESPNQQIYMITGVRGSGKTVFMTSVAKKIQEMDNWIVLELNSSGEILKELAAKLYNIKGMSRKFSADGINLSFWGIGINIKKSEPLTDLATAVEMMLDHLAKDKKKILITIDEVSNTPEMRYFAGAYQILIRHDHPLFLIMTGLYENINRLQNEDNLTFLYRAPKIYLGALNTYRIAETYEASLKLAKEDALKLAKLSKGYSFAFQVIGYFVYNNKGNLEKSLPDIRQYLDEYVYDKMWIELSGKEQELLIIMSNSDIKDVKTLKEKFNSASNQFSIYRDRLVKKGILDGSRRGYLEFALPFLDDFIREKER